MNPRRKKSGLRSNKPRPARRKGLFIMALLAGLGVLAGIWISPRKSGELSPLVKAPMPGREPLYRANDLAWLEARLRILWENLGIRQEHIATLSGSGGQEFPKVLEVRLPPHLTLGSASKALEALGREAPAQVEIGWEKEETNARLAVISLGGVLTWRILLLEEGTPKTLSFSEKPKIAVIMDDLGEDERVFRLLKDQGIPTTLAFLPTGAKARKMAQEAKAMGMEVMVHMPMEPKAYPTRNPGVRALMVSMDGQEAAQLIQFQLDQLPQAAGANNHMGSKFTEDPQHMAILMDMLAKRSMYFVDSLTSPHSVAYNIARQKGLRAYRRDVFLDNSRSSDGIKVQFQALLNLARKRGYALAICHPYPQTLALLPELYKLSREQEISWVRVSELPWESIGNGVPLASRKMP